MKARQKGEDLQPYFSVCERAIRRKTILALLRVIKVCPAASELPRFRPDRTPKDLLVVAAN